MELVRTWYQNIYGTGVDSGYLNGAIVKVTGKTTGQADERSILIERRDKQFVLLPAKTPYWADKSCNFMVTPEKNIYVALSAAEAVVADESIWHSVEPTII